MMSLSIYENVHSYFQWYSEQFGRIAQSLSAFFYGFQGLAADSYLWVIRWVLPALAIVIFIRCVLPLVGGKAGDAPLGLLVTPTGERLPFFHLENSIGRSRLSDIVIHFSSISRSHAVLTFHGGNWMITDLGSRGGVEVNGRKIEEPEIVRQGDTLSLAGLKLTLIIAEAPPGSESRGASRAIIRLGRSLRYGATFSYIVLFQLLGGLQICFSEGRSLQAAVPGAFALLILTEFVYYLTARLRRQAYFELEMLAFFLCGIGLFAIASASPSSLLKQLVAIWVGLAAFVALTILFRDLDRAQKLKIFFLAAGVVLMLLNLVIGQVRNGAKNWIDLGFITFQPMEFVKIAFVLAGTATLDRLLTTRNLTSFIVFSGACIGTLAITKDFGTALVFFCAFLVIAFMRSGDIRTIALISAGALLGAFAVVSFLPYVSSRFKAWGHVWQYADTSGFQQTRTMVAAASGGLLGVGGGHGYLIKIAAADADLVFGVICEEWGMIIALVAVFIIVFLAFYAVSSVKKCRSSFYAIAACGAVSILLMQTALNVFGSLDILPLTGVTFPFVSNGGSSMITCWCLLAFIKSVHASEQPVPAAGGDSEEEEGEAE